MKFLKSIITSTFLLALLGASGQNFTQDRSADVPILPDSPEKLSKVILDLKMKATNKDKSGVHTAHAVTFYTTAYYRYSGKGAGGKAGGEIGFALEGISDATYQAIADETGKYFQSKLKQSGFTLESLEKLKGAKKFDKVAEKAGKPGVEVEMQNLGLTKKVKAKVFTLGNQPAYKVEGTNIFPVVNSMKTGVIDTNFKINFMSFGKDVSSGSGFENGRDVGITTVQAITLPSIHGNGGLSFINGKVKAGSLATGIYRHLETDLFTITEETKDGFWVVQADEAKFKQYCTEFINKQIDLMMKYYQQEVM
ncbi:MAG: hypothetical protein KI790_08715 [Cyclobacteriaceae bacterium]|nr:hypothetical protein [Cyclobacteriaceae bacterium HetDA_MAG_MS6]